MTDPHVLVTVKEYAALFRRHPMTIRIAIRRGRFPYPVERPTGSSRILIRVPRDVVSRLDTHQHASS